MVYQKIIKVLGILLEKMKLKERLQDLRFITCHIYNNLYKKEGALIFNNLNTVFEEFGNHKELMVIGGAEIYKLVLPFTNKLYLTHIHKEFHGDTWFPNLCLSNWEVIEEEAHKNEDIQIEYTYKTYFRISE